MLRVSTSALLPCWKIKRNMYCRVHVCHGPWPTDLITHWDAYEGESENTHPSLLPPMQLYALLILPHGGIDLEHHSPLMIQQCRSIISQMVLALAAVEEEMEFEHRDLHWGNVLVRNIEESEWAQRRPWSVGGVDRSLEWEGIEACVIDYTWSRVGTGDDLIYAPMEDPTLFTGKGKGKRGGDLQFDVYRWMRDETLERWEEFHPQTNVFVSADFVLSLNLNNLTRMIVHSGYTI